MSGQGAKSRVDGAETRHARAEFAVEPSPSREGGSLPEGVFHLVIADDDLATRAFRRRMAVCGAVVQPQGLPPSALGDEGDEIECNPRYCPACVGEALRWEAEDERDEQDEDYRAGFMIGECGHRRPIWPNGNVDLCECERRAT